MSKFKKKYKELDGWDFTRRIINKNLGELF